ncbi:MAG: NAD(P)/FAD-dependent oxidoreductase [Methanoregulaceae archaeon]
MTTVILGAGLTGCTLARLLADAGEEVTVLEAGARPGGLCQSITRDGFTFDLGGSHIIFSRDQEVLAWILQVLETNREERRRETKCWYQGAYIHYPFENGLGDLPPEDRFRCLDGFVRAMLAEELAASRRETRPARHFLDWIRRTFGDGIADCYLVPYNEKIWKYPLERMSAHWVDGRVPRPPLEDVLRSACGIPTEGYTHQAIFSYPATGGIEALVEAIDAPLRDRIQCGYRVSSVRRERDKFVVSDGVREINADRCISTIPVQALLEALDGVPQAVRDAGERLVYNSVACIFIGLKGPVPPYSWVYLAAPELGYANRISFPSNYSSGMAPPGCGSILAECTYRQDDPPASMSDQALIDHVVDHLEEMGVLKKEDVIYTGCARQPFAYVVYDIQYRESIRCVRTHIERQGIELVGRFAEFEYLNMDGCIRHALDHVRRTGSCV